MKTLSFIIGGILIGLYCLATICYWASIYGGIGLFGSILTFPISVFIAFIFLAFGNIPAFIINVGWVGIAFLLIYLGSET